jgi:hypothetical protein
MLVALEHDTSLSSAAVVDGVGLLQWVTVLQNDHCELRFYGGESRRGVPLPLWAPPMHWL